MGTQTIENLQIEITGTATSANTNIDALAASLSKLKSTAKSGLNLNAVVNQLGKFNTALKDISVPNGTSDAMQKLTEALAPLQSVPKATGLESVVKQLKAIPTIIESLKNTNMDEFAAQIQRVTTAVMPLATEMEKISNGFSAFPARIQKLITQNEKLSSSNAKLNKTYGVLGSGIKGVYLKMYAMTAVYTRAINVLADWFTESNDYVEALNLFNVTMGDAAKGAYAYAESVQKLMGIDIKEWMTAQGSFQQMVVGYGVASDYATTISRNLTQIGYDLSSLWNVDVETAMDKLQSGMSGQIKGLKAWGINLSVAALQETALAHGIDYSVRKMSEADKAILRYVTIMEKTTNVQGDLGRTLITPSNALRILNSQVTQAKRALGQMVSVLAAKVIPYVQAFVELVKEGAENLANLWGYKLPEIDYSNLDTGWGDVEDGIDDATDAAETFKKTVLGIDELNLMADNSKTEDSGSKVSGLLENLPDNNKWLDGIENTVDAIKEKMRKWFDIAVAIGEVVIAWKIGESVINFFASLNTALPLIKTIFGNGAGGLGYSLNAAMSAFNNSAAGGGGFFTNIGTGLSTFRNSLSGVNKAIFGSAGLIAGFTLSKSAGKRFAEDGVLTMTSALTGLTGVASGALGGYIIGGPLGAAIGGFIALYGAVDGAMDVQAEYRLEMLRTDYYDQNGKKLSEVQTALENYFNSLDFDKNAEWVQAINTATESYDNARESYDKMWSDISSKTEIDSSDIEGLADAFNSLAEAASAVNKARLDSLMANISTSIQKNITPELNSRLGGLLDKIQQAKDILGSKISGLNARYQEIIDNIAERSSGKDSMVIMPYEYDELKSLRSDLAKFTLSDDASSKKWEISVGDALKTGLNAGSNSSEVESNVKSLTSSRDAYLESLKEKYSKDMTTLEQLIKIDKEQFNGALGFSTADMDALTQSYEAQKAFVATKYNEVLDALINQYASEALNYDDYYTGSGLTDFLANFGSTIAWGLGDESALDWKANKALAAEQQDLLKKLEAMKISGYATGGFPEDGLFYANHNELVGQFSNGNTAVVNNEQIVEGIKRAVKEGMTESGGQSGGDWIIQVVDTYGNIRSTSVITALDRKNKRDGKTVIPVG